MFAGRWSGRKTESRRAIAAPSRHNEVSEAITLSMTARLTERMPDDSDFLSSVYN